VGKAGELLSAKWSQSGKFVRLLAFLAVALLNACVSTATNASATQGGASQSQEKEAIFTAAAQTVIAQLTQSASATAARLTQSAGATAVVQLTQIAATATTAPAPATPTPPPTAPATVPPISKPCDAAQLLADLTASNGTLFPPGAEFVKTWRIQNTGSCTWTPAYGLVFAGGDLLGGVTEVSISQNVDPGQSLDLSLNLVAPRNPGVYTGQWLLRNPSGGLFGVGENGQETLVVRIGVIALAVNPNDAYDFAANYCMADWLSGQGALPCPEVAGDPAGFVQLLTQPALESGTSGQFALWSRPNEDISGWISGQYPPYFIQSGDHFRAEIGCLSASQGCNLTFDLEYQTQSGGRFSLGSWDETYDGLTTSLNIDLSDLAGSVVQFILSVTNQGRPASANGFWLAPRIQNIPTTTGLVLTWNRTLSGESICDELRVYLTGTTSGSARAIDCAGQRHQLGETTLDPDELDQVLEWMRTLRSFDGQVHQPGSIHAVDTFIDFNGTGGSVARDTEIRAINSFAEQLFNRIVGEG
jgi:hypothetical protein